MFKWITQAITKVGNPPPVLLPKPIIPPVPLPSAKKDDPPRARPLVTNREVAAGMGALRGILEDNNASSFVSNEQCESIVTAILVAGARRRTQTET